MILDNTESIDSDVDGIILHNYGEASEDNPEQLHTAPGLVTDAVYFTATSFGGFILMLKHLIR